MTVSPTILPVVVAAISCQTARMRLGLRGSNQCGDHEQEGHHPGYQQGNKFDP